jgi:iron(III) transport system ATP-binding protein
MTPVLELEGIALAFDGRPILDGVSLAVAPKQILALAGPSGSGKTSLLRIALGLLLPSRGAVRLRGRTVSDGTRIVVPPEERGLAMVFQDLALWPHLSVHGNLGFALDARGTPRAERDRRIRDMLARVGLAGCEQRAPASLSGGERQRVAIARALVTEPDLVLFDEPLANLDVALKAEMLALIHQLLAQAGTAAIYVTHDAQEAERLAAEVVVLESGRITQTGTLVQVAADPQTPFVRAFAGGQ